jgi:hypothetical protein
MIESFRRGWLVAMAVVPMFGPLPAAAQETDETALIHWAYAATFGTGVYELGESTEALVVRAPFSLRLRTADPSKRCNCGLRLLLPVAVGVQNFDIDALLAGDFPRRVEQVSFLPGVEIELPRNERWTLRVRAQVGWGTELGGDQDSAWIYAAGIRSRLMWPERKLRPTWIIGMQSTGYDAEHLERQSLARLTNGIELDIGVPRWEFREEPMRLMPYVLNDQYVDSVHVFSVVDEAVDELDSEWEIGVAAGRDRPFSIFGIEFDRVGIGFRFSEESRGIRILFGSIF